MSDIVTIVSIVVVGYALGAIPVADLVARRRGSIDLRRVGDRNPGYWNAKAQLGRRAALPVFVGDLAKGALAAGLGALVAGDGQWWMAYIGGGAAMVGHAFPAFAGFRGGRSVLTFAGAASVAAPLPALAAWSILAIGWIRLRRFDWAARIGVVAFPVCQIIIEGPYRTAATGVLMTFVGLRFAAAAIMSRRRARATPGGGA